MLIGGEEVRHMSDMKVHVNGGQLKKSTDEEDDPAGSTEIQRGILDIRNSA